MPREGDHIAAVARGAGADAEERGIAFAGRILGPDLQFVLGVRLEVDEGEARDRGFETEAPVVIWRSR